MPKIQAKPPRRGRRAVHKKSPARVNTIKDRRKKFSERRRNEAIAQFPIITTQGICVRRDRRKIPDRRISNIVVCMANLKEEVFDILFSNYLRYKERQEMLAQRKKSGS